MVGFEAVDAENDHVTERNRTMVQLLCLIMGFVYMGQKRKMLRLSAAQFPGVPPKEFYRWRTLEIKSIDIFLWATWGTFGLGLLIGVASIAITGFSGFGVGVGQLILLGIFLLGLLLSAAAGSEAARLKKKLGISLRKRR
jgi:hypothetical protein